MSTFLYRFRQPAERPTRLGDAVHILSVLRSWRRRLLKLPAGGGSEREILQLARTVCQDLEAIAACATGIESEVDLGLDVWWRLAGGGRGLVRRGGMQPSHVAEHVRHARAVVRKLAADFDALLGAAECEARVLDDSCAAMLAGKAVPLPYEGVVARDAAAAPGPSPA